MTLPAIYTVTLRDTDTGEIRQFDYRDGPTRLFFWTEGNFSCDCNRGEVFYRAEIDRGERAPLSFGCGEGRFELIRLQGGDGTIYYPLQGEK
jgi:hypothetical protein